MQLQAGICFCGARMAHLALVGFCHIADATDTPAYVYSPCRFLLVKFADESAEGGGGGSGSGSAAAAPVAASPRMSLSGWQAALADLAARIFPSTTKVDAFQRLFTRHITFYGARPPAMLEDEATALLCTPDVASRMQRYRSSLQTIYKFYAAQQDIKTGDWASVSAAKVSPNCLA